MQREFKVAQFRQKDLVEFKDYQDLKSYTGVVESVIHTETDPLSDYTYVLSHVNFGNRDTRFLSGPQSQVHVIERNILRKLDILNPAFLEKNGWFKSTDPEHPENLYIKNRFPIALQFNPTHGNFWVYDARAQPVNSFFVMEPIFNEKEYDDLVIPFLLEHQ